MTIRRRPSVSREERQQAVKEWIESSMIISPSDNQEEQWRSKGHRIDDDSSTIHTRTEEIVNDTNMEQPAERQQAMRKLTISPRAPSPGTLQPPEPTNESSSLNEDGQLTPPATTGRTWGDTTNKQTPTQHTFTSEPESSWIADTPESSGPDSSLPDYASYGENYLPLSSPVSRTRWSSAPLNTSAQEAEDGEDEDKDEDEDEERQVIPKAILTTVERLIEINEYLEGLPECPVDDEDEALRVELTVEATEQERIIELWRVSATEEEEVRAWIEADGKREVERRKRNGGLGIEKRKESGEQENEVGKDKGSETREENTKIHDTLKEDDAEAMREAYTNNVEPSGGDGEGKDG